MDEIKAGELTVVLGGQYVDAATARKACKLGQLVLNALWRMLFDPESFNPDTLLLWA